MNGLNFSTEKAFIFLAPEIKKKIMKMMDVQEIWPVFETYRLDRKIWHHIRVMCFSFEDGKKLQALFNYRKNEIGIKSEIHYELQEAVHFRIDFNGNNHDLRSEKNDALVNHLKYLKCDIWNGFHFWLDTKRAEKMKKWFAKHGFVENIKM